MSSTTSGLATIGAGAAAGAAGGPIGSAVGAATAAVKVGLADLIQHTARLKDATGENQALDAVIPAFDADLKAVAAAFSNGSASAALCIQALQQIDINIFTNLYALTQKKLPGIAWGGPTTQTIGQSLNPTYTAACNKNCTASCCVYLNDLRPAIYGRSVPTNAFPAQQISPGIVGGMIGAIQHGGGTVKVVPVAAPPNSAYGNFSRATYNIVLTPPPVQSAIAQTVSEMTGGNSIALPDGTVVQGTTGIAAFSSSSALSSPLLIVVGVGILVLALLFVVIGGGKGNA